MKNMTYDQKYDIRKKLDELELPLTEEEIIGIWEVLDMAYSRGYYQAMGDLQDFIEEQDE